ncbi:helix-turn-helix transcriptional regulator [Gryllotalpicola sp.]|uniref:helix-turn-helix domain-containing protein n=1 Tax=Gryllotalpicola sp. TaxID=1932787 RepID=UPI00260E8532|nr:helix-turn-helix transcriptional regulator [Gryllotalpicola sp.]
MSIAHEKLREQLAINQGDWLRKALGLHDVSSNEMAEYLGVSRTTISNYLNGRTKPNRATLREWAIKTGAPLVYLQTGALPDNPDDGLKSLDSPQITER